MYDPGNVAQQGQNDVNPEVLANADLQKDTQRRQQYRYDNSNQIQLLSPFQSFTSPTREQPAEFR
tara:strand:- start:2724 stop:2918 length:195 start_codon:yes stop_codon:yes gene_type:complete